MSFKQRIVAGELPDHIERIEPIDQLHAQAAGPCRPSQRITTYLQPNVSPADEGLPALPGRIAAYAVALRRRPACCRCEKKVWAYVNVKLASFVGRPCRLPQ